MLQSQRQLIKASVLAESNLLRGLGGLTTSELKICAANQASIPPILKTKIMRGLPLQLNTRRTRGFARSLRAISPGQWCRFTKIRNGSQLRIVFRLPPSLRKAAIAATHFS